MISADGMKKIYEDHRRLAEEVGISLELCIQLRMVNLMATLFIAPAPQAPTPPGADPQMVREVIEMQHDLLTREKTEREMGFG